MGWLEALFPFPGARAPQDSRERALPLGQELGGRWEAGKSDRQHRDPSCQGGGGGAGAGHMIPRTRSPAKSRQKLQARPW